MNPAGQLHDPLCLSHMPPFSHPGQISPQPRPQKPSGHTAKIIMNIFMIFIMYNLSQLFRFFFIYIKKCKHSQFSQWRPDVPAGHWHCPVTLSHGAPVQLQEWTQPGPNLPSGQADSGHAGRIRVNAGPWKQTQISLKHAKIKPSTLIAVLPMNTWRAFSLALSGHVVTRHSWGTGTLPLTAGSISAWLAF